MISSFRFIRFITPVTVWMVLLLAAPRLGAAVSLSYFQAEADAGAAAIRLSWATETEVNVAAFRLMRNTTPILATAVQVNQQPAQGTNIGGATYTFVDSGVYRSVTYYYWLYELTNDGQLSVQRTSLMPQDYLSLTAPSSAPPAPSPTATATVAAATTATLLPTTPAVQQPSATPALAPAASQTPAVTPIASRPAAASPTPDAPGAVSVDGPPPTQALSPTSVSTAPATGGPIAEATAAPVATQSPTAPLAATPAPAATLPPARATSIASTPVESAASPADAPPLALDATTPLAELPTAQALAQAAASATPAATGELLAALQSRPTATPRPAGAPDTPGNATDLLLVVGGGAVCGAGLLAAVALVVWRRR